jgi:hypothetical protein
VSGIPVAARNQEPPKWQAFLQRLRQRYLPYLPWQKPQHGTATHTGVMDPPPPVPSTLVKLLHEHPAHLTRLRDAMDRAAATPSVGIPYVERIIWTMEDTLDSFVIEAQAACEAAARSGDGEQMRRTQATLLLLREARPQHMWVKDPELQECFGEAWKAMRERPRPRNPAA